MRKTCADPLLGQRSRTRSKRRCDTVTCALAAPEAARDRPNGRGRARRRQCPQPRPTGYPAGDRCRRSTSSSRSNPRRTGRSSTAAEAPADGSPCAQASRLGGTAAVRDDATRCPSARRPSPFGIVPGSFEADFFDAAYPFGEAVPQAGDHPFEFRFNFDLTARTETPAHHDTASSSCDRLAVKTVEVTLPRGHDRQPRGAAQVRPGQVRRSRLDRQLDRLPGRHPGRLHQRRAAGQRSAALQRPERAARARPDLQPRAAQGQAGRPRLQRRRRRAGPHLPRRSTPLTTTRSRRSCPNIAGRRVAARRRSDRLGRARRPRARQAPLLPRSADPKRKTIAGAPFGSAAIRPFFTNPMDCGVENGGVAHPAWTPTSTRANFTPGRRNTPNR